MQFWVYLLRCADGSYYAGHTDNLEGRLWQHQQGIGCDWTRKRRPVELVWTDSAPTRDEAFAFERRIKGWTRAKKEALIAGDWNRLSALARGTNISAHPERRREGAEVEGRCAPTSSARPSTSLRTSEPFSVAEGGESARPERRRDSAEVEGRSAQTSQQRPSTSLRTSERAARAGEVP